MENKSLKQLKSLFLVITLLVSTADSYAQQCKGDKLATAKSTKSAKVTYVYSNTPGFIIKDKNGKMKGLLVDVMKEFEAYVKEKKGIILTSKYDAIPKDDFNVLLKKVKAASGGVFGLSNITITKERKKSYLFSPSYISNVSVLISHESVPTLKNLSELSTTFKDKTAHIIEGSTHEIWTNSLKKHYPELKISFLPSETDILKKVATDKNAFSRVDFIYYLAALQNKQPIKRHAVGDSESEELGVLMPKSNDWAPLLTEFFNAGFVGSTKYRKIISDNLGQNALVLLDSLTK